MKISKSIAMVALAILSSVTVFAKSAENKGAIPLTVIPNHTAITADDRRLFVAGDGGVDVVDTATFEVVATLAEGKHVVAVTVGGNDSYLYMLLDDGDIVSAPLGPIDGAGPGKEVDLPIEDVLIGADNNNVDMDKITDELFYPACGILSDITVPGDVIPLSAAASSPDDNYVYVADEEKIHVLTSNPWIDKLSWRPEHNDGAEDITVVFRSDAAGDFEVRRGGDIHRTGDLIVEGIIPTAGDMTEFTISPDDMEEGTNDIYIFVTDSSGNVGRLGFTPGTRGCAASPQITNLPATVSTQWYQSGSYHFNATDADTAEALIFRVTDTCTFTALIEKIDSTTGVVSWTCRGVETCTVGVEVEDDCHNIATGESTIKCINTNALEAPSFSLDFGDEKVFVTIKTLAVANVAGYVIYYSSDWSDLDPEPANTGAKTKYISDFEPGSKRKVTIENLKSGTRYHFRVRAIDLTGNPGKLSDIKSIVAQGTTTYTESTDDSGPSCAALPPDKNSSALSAAVLLLLWAVTAALIRRRILQSGRVK